MSSSFCKNHLLKLNGCVTFSQKTNKSIFKVWPAVCSGNAIRHKRKVTILMEFNPELFACWVIFHALVVVCWLFFKINFFKKIFQELYQSVKWFGSRSGPIFCDFSVGPDLGQNCLTKVATSNEKVEASTISATDNKVSVDFVILLDIFDQNKAWYFMCSFASKQFT